LIKKSHYITNSNGKKALHTILNAGLDASSPILYLKNYISKNKIFTKSSSIDLKKFDNVFLIAIGKSAGIMAEHAVKKINFKSGLIIVPNDVNPNLKKSSFSIIKAGHPQPNSSSFTAGKKLIKFLDQTKKNDFVLFLISGGGSALAVSPYSISLKEKIKVNDVLIRSGANINEIACVRKHLSLIKGGRLLENMLCSGISLISSDVIGDDPGSISSGISYCDKTTYQDALNIIKKYSIIKKIPNAALSQLKLGVKGKIPETPKKPKIPYIIISNNFNCLTQMKDKALELGYSVKILKNLTGDVNYVSEFLKSTALKSKKNCILFGGEPTVNVVGNGKGGRNQELILHLYEKLKNNKNYFEFASIGTDGIDGNTKFAGAEFSNRKLFPVKKFLKTNNSSSFFKKFGGLIETGITQNNVNDIGVIIKITE
tara:strand:+ start:86 stop:1369 length:1284 start_codon:yes stop_codon:yes gene_type:complete